MQSADITTYDTNLITLLGTAKTAENTSSILSQIATLETNRNTVIAQQNGTEETNYDIHLIQNEAYNTVIRFGSISCCYYNYADKIRNAPDEDKPTHIQAQQALRETLKNEIDNNIYSHYFKCLVRFVKDNF